MILVKSVCKIDVIFKVLAYHRAWELGWLLIIRVLLIRAGGFGVCYTGSNRLGSCLRYLCFLHMCVPVMCVVFKGQMYVP